MTYEETIDWLYQQLPMFSRVGISAYKKDLHNTIALCEFLGNPEHRFKSIHVAGTNGKGSTSHMLAAIMQQAGYKTGLYTSPHIHDFRERIRINGVMADKAFVTAFVQRTMPITEQIKPSFFELTVAMAFEYFAENNVDIAIIETGLGGRLDSTNVVSPILSIITNIGMDHTNMLGNTLAEIAYEKAGIIKPNTPVLIGETLPETLHVFTTKAAAVHAELYLAEQLFHTVSSYKETPYTTYTIKNSSSGNTQQWRSVLSGSYQQKNICTVLCVVKVLNGLGYAIADNAIQTGLEDVKKLTGLEARWDIVETHPHVILDVAHNEDGIKAVMQQLADEYRDAQKHFVLGFVNDKDISKLLSLFPTDAKYYFTNAHIPRALGHDALREMAAQYGLTGEGFDDINAALAAAKKNASSSDVIMICGSFFTIAELHLPPA